MSASVRGRLQSDSEVGLFLSEGIDSTILGVIAAAESTKRLTNFPVVYAAQQDEAPRPAATAQKLDSAHTSLAVRSFAPQNLEEVCAYLNQPHADGANVAQALLSHLVSEQVRVVITGDVPTNYSAAIAVTINQKTCSNARGR